MRTSASLIKASAATVIAALLLALLPGAGLAVPDEPDDQTLQERIGGQQKELERIKKEIETHRAESRKLRQQEKTALKKLSALEKEIDLSRQFLRNLEQQESLMSERVDSLRANVELVDTDLTLQEEIFIRRLRQMYKRDPNHRWDILLGSENLQQALRRYKFTRLVAEQDAVLITEMRMRKLTLESESAALTESLADMAVVRTEREEETKKLERSKRERNAMLANIRTEKSETAQAIKDLESAQQELKDLIGRLESQRLEQDRGGYVAERDFGKLKGKLIRPVDGKIVRGFGKQRHPKYGTVTFNNGVDIGSTAGAPIRTVAPGMVEFVDWIDGYGKCIILNHGGGYYTLYAHVSATFVAQGQTVAGGEVIAEVGDTGSLGGFDCHFEIRKSKQALNPMECFAR
jgi:septal ring factor EnvC (AmiA/AmiB activator)